MGTLPTVKISLKDETTKSFYDDELQQAYPVHYEIQQIVQGEISSIKNYIKNLEAIWENKSDEISKEIDKSIDSLIDKTKKILKESL